MNENTYTITLADGTKLSNLHLNGNNFVSESPIIKEQFEYNCSPVIISNCTFEEKHENMELIHLQITGDQYYFILADIPEQELFNQKIMANLQYLSMMTGNDLDQ